MSLILDDASSILDDASSISLTEPLQKLKATARELTLSCFKQPQENKLMASDKRKGFGRLLLAVSQSWRRALTQHLSKEGVSGTAALLVLEMLHLGSRQLRQYELARRLGLENSAVVRLLDGLENSGFVCRQEDSVDRRAKLLSLTEKGIDLGNRLDHLAGSLRLQILSNIPQEDLEIVEKTLSCMLENLDSCNERGRRP
ncbi:UNVERIFIED_ORG: MarR family transcriptional regulator for hemolysin [Kosakonia oryzae]|nr:MarR family transcriptional regulator [Kosakonia radicincitans]MDP9567546.1 MarR family transcriptional regulator for hemolysin [Kosakonia oryzae]